MAALEASIAASKGPSGGGSEAQAPSRSARTAPRAPRRRRPPRSRWPRRRVEVEVEGRRLSLSNLDKVLYPRTRVHQGPGDRLLHARRAGRAAAPARPRRSRSSAIRTGSRASTSTRRTARRTRPSGCARSASARSTTASATTCRRSSGSPTWPTSSCTRRCRRRADMEHPTVMAFDLDPGPGAGLPECCEVALLLRDALAAARPRQLRRRPRARRGSRSTCR